MGIICLNLVSGHIHPDGRALEPGAGNGWRVSGYRLPAAQREHQTRTKLLAVAKSQLGVREATGNNDGVVVEAYLKVTGLAKGHAWCAAFLSWVFQEAGFEQPRSPWVPALFPKRQQTAAPEPADIYGLYSSTLKRLAHCGMVERRYHDWIIGIEGNTNIAGSREGDGVYRKWRHTRSLSAYANWIQGQKGGGDEN